jgi:glucokinase
MILAGDIGGTKTVLALYEETSGGLQLVGEAPPYSSRDHQSLEQILSKFLEAEKALSLRAACFGVAGPVLDGKSQITNLPWLVDEQALARFLKGAPVKLLNDLEATAYGMLFLRPDELCVLNPGVPSGRRGNIAIVAAGTGLGEAMLYWDGRRHHPMASEGGHADFAPRTDQEIELLKYLRSKFGDHVSYERILSGPGLHNIYKFLRDSDAYSEPAYLAERLKTEDPGTVITQLGLEGEEPIAVATLELFAALYGAEAGNLALKCVAVGGVFVGGGIAPKLLPALQTGAFMRAFTDKGRLAELMNRIQVSVALNPRAGLLGAAHYALSL